MSTAPLHYRQYWSYQDNDRELLKKAESVLLKYIQSWGQTNRERLEKLQDAAIFIGFDVEIVEHNGEEVFKTKDPDFDKMRQEIRSISRGNWESEAGQIYRILQKYAEINWKKKPWYKKLYKSLQAFIESL